MQKILQKIKENLKILVQANENELTPPSTPPSPPGPPAPIPTVWTQDDFKFYLKSIQKEQKELENIAIGDQIITLNNIQHLRPQTGQNWQQRINHLLFETRIPIFWVIQFVPIEENEEENNENYETEDPYPRRINIFCINYQVKKRILEILENFFLNEYDNIVYI